MNEEPEECPKCHNKRIPKERRSWRLIPVIVEGEEGLYLCMDCHHRFKPASPISKRIIMTTNYGAWSTTARRHAVVVERDDQVGDTGKRLCDGRESMFNMGFAGSLSSITCRKCRTKLARLRAEGAIIVEAR